MSSARDDILKKLRDATATDKPFPRDTTPSMIPATKLAGDEDLAQRFTAEVERVKGVVHPAGSEADALRTLRDLLSAKGAKRVTMWDQQHIDLQGIEPALAELGITRIQGSNDDVATADAGITGCDWAIAATGTLVLSSGAGKPRMASLLPPVHIAIVTTDRLIPRLEDYIAAQRAGRLGVFRRSSNVTLITGCSRTSDIEMHPVFGVHGPLELHVILIDNLAGE
jgi:L-lactate dehydrogenase complex protein LldG